MGWIKSTLLGLSANSQKPFSSITQLSVWHAIITLKFTVIIINQSMSWGTLNYWRKKQNQHQTILLSHKFLPTIIYSPAAAAAATKSLQLCLTLCDPIDGSQPGSPVPGILQARTLEWVAISFSSAWKWKLKVKSLSCIQLFATPWTAAYQAPPSMGFSRQEYWSGVPLPSPIYSPKDT